MPFLRLLMLFYECPKTGLHASKVKKYFSKKNSFNFNSFLNDSFEESVSLSPASHCCDWSDGAVLCDWSTARMTAMGGDYANVLLCDVTE